MASGRTQEADRPIVSGVCTSRASAVSAFLSFIILELQLMQILRQIRGFSSELLNSCVDRVDD